MCDRCIDLDENCDIYGEASPKSMSSEHSHIQPSRTQDPRANHILNAENIVEEVMRKMNLAMKQPQRQWQMRAPGVDPPPPRPVNKWCAIEGKWINHKTNEFSYKPRNVPQHYGNPRQPPRYAMNQNPMERPLVEKPMSCRFWGGNNLPF